MKFFEKLLSLFKREGKVYNGDGTPSSNNELDAMRGMHFGRAQEQMKFSLNLKKRRLGNPVHEWFESGHSPGADPVVDIIPDDESGEDIKRRLWTRGGMYYTGRVKTYEWEYKGYKQFQCLAENVYWDRSARKFVHGWQGPQGGPGYYVSDKLVWIEGPLPKIKGALYQEES